MHSVKRRNSLLITAAVTAAVIFAIWLYGSLDPADPSAGKYFPKCVFKLVTGWQCPACGLQRSLHALVKGDIIGALRFNWFILFSLSYLFAVLVARQWFSPTSRFRRFICGIRGAYIYIFLYFSWLIVRNILKI